jgi:hypothetical protein
MKVCNFAYFDNLYTFHNFYTFGMSKRQNEEETLVAQTHASHLRQIYTRNQLLKM